MAVDRGQIAIGTKYKDQVSTNADMEYDSKVLTGQKLRPEEQRSDIQVVAMLGFGHKRIIDRTGLRAVIESSSSENGNDDALSYGVVKANTILNAKTKKCRKNMKNKVGLFEENQETTQRPEVGSRSQKIIKRVKMRQQTERHLIKQSFGLEYGMSPTKRSHRDLMSLIREDAP